MVMPVEVVICEKPFIEKTNMVVIKKSFFIIIIYWNEYKVRAIFPEIAMREVNTESRNDVYWMKCEKEALNIVKRKFSFEQWVSNSF